MLLPIAGMVAMLAGCGGADFGSSTATVEPSGAVPAAYRQLAGWSRDTVAAAVPAFLRSCGRLMQRSDAASLDPAAPYAWFGRVGDWRRVCREAAVLPQGDEAAARRFFESDFVPVPAGNGGVAKALFTGYYEVELQGSRTREGPYRTPVYRRPPDLAARQAPLDRAAIEEGALAGRGLEVVWLKDPADLLLLHAPTLAL